MREYRTAIVTGAGKRVGKFLAETLVQQGWTVVAHVRRQDDPVPAGTVRAVADLAQANCAERIFAGIGDLPPVRLLINNAARFAHDGFGAFQTEELDRHMAINLRAPLLLSEEMANRHEKGSDGLIVNILDSKLAAPNPDFLSYTLSKQALAGFTELAARAYSGVGLRVNGVAPSLMLQSAGQSAENFEAMHARNPLRRGVEPRDVMTAIRYLLDTPSVTGEILTIDSGQRFEPPGRDVQMMETP